MRDGSPMEGLVFVNDIILAINDVNTREFTATQITHMMKDTVNEERKIFSEVAFGFDNFYQCNYEIWGSKGKITSTRAFTAKANFKPSIILEKQGYKEEIELSKDDHFANMILYFISMVETKSFETEWRNLLTQAKLIDDVRKLSGS